MTSKSIKVKLKLPLLDIEGTWSPDKHEIDAAWEMYIELITRIAIVELKPNEGLLREALSSLHSLFNTTRGILKEKGSSIAKSKGKNKVSFGYIAVSILNRVLRPLLAEWHPLLLDYENKRKRKVSPLQHEQKWKYNQKLRDKLNEARRVLIDYAHLLEDVINIPSLISEDSSKNGEI